MSLCRWSSMDGMCDLYIYDSVGDFLSVNIAGRRTKRPWSECSKVPMIRKDGSVVMCHKLDGTLSDEPVTVTPDDEYEDLPAPHAGQTYNFGYSQEERERLDKLLSELREAGFRWPDDLSESLDESFAEYGEDDSQLWEAR